VICKEGDWVAVAEKVAPVLEAFVDAVEFEISCGVVVWWVPEVRKE
jgi:hypothetical protein